MVRWVTNGVVDRQLGASFTMLENKTRTLILNHH